MKTDEEETIDTTEDGTYGAIKLPLDNDNETETLISSKENDDSEKDNKAQQQTRDITVISKSWAVVLANIAGILGIMQTGTNTCLSTEFFPNPVAACGVSFIIGLLTMIFIICFVDSSRLPRLEDLRGCPWYYFVGGILGGSYKTAAIVLAPRIGFATFHIAAVAGQVCEYLQE